MSAKTTFGDDAALVALQDTLTVRADNGSTNGVAKPGRFAPCAAVAGLLHRPADYLRAPVVLCVRWRRPEIASPGVPYVDYLMSGIFVPTAVFGAMNTAVGLSADVQSGMLEHFRSLPMARSAVLAGRTIADLVRNAFVVAQMVGVGYLDGCPNSQRRPGIHRLGSVSCCCLDSRCRDIRRRGPHPRRP